MGNQMLPHREDQALIWRITMTEKDTPRSSTPLMSASNGMCMSEDVAQPAKRMMVKLLCLVSCKRPARSSMKTVYFHPYKHEPNWLSHVSRWNNTSTRTRHVQQVTEVKGVLPHTRPRTPLAVGKMTLWRRVRASTPPGRKQCRVSRRWW